MEIRPTSDRLRETLFDVLTAGNPTALEGTVWIDLYAGTGAVGIEALSRGASSLYFAESSKAAVDLIRKNLSSLGIARGFQILREEAVRALHRWAAEKIRANYLFLDPPYDSEQEYDKALTAITEVQLMTPEGIVIAEHQKIFDPGDQFTSLKRFRLLRQGDAALSFYSRK